MSRPSLVLMYHAFATEPLAVPDPGALHVQADALAMQLRTLAQQRFRFLSLDEYLARNEAGGDAERTCLVTIDDGYRSVLDVALPVLAAAAVRPVLFVPTDCVAGDSGGLGAPAVPPSAAGAPLKARTYPLLDADELRVLAGNGWSIGAHGSSHTSMISVTPAELHRQTVHAKRSVEAITATPCRAFAYPFGYFDGPATLAVARAGFDVGFSVHRDLGPFARARVDVNATDTPRTFRLKMVPHYRRMWSAAGHLRGLRPLVRGLGGGRHRTAAPVAGPRNCERALMIETPCADSRAVRTVDTLQASR